MAQPGAAHIVEGEGLEAVPPQVGLPVEGDPQPVVAPVVAAVEEVNMQDADGQQLVEQVDDQGDNNLAANNNNNNNGELIQPAAVVAGVNATVQEQMALAIQSMVNALANAQGGDANRGSGKAVLQKELHAKFPAPNKASWTAETSHKFCKAVGDYVLARGLKHDTSQAALWGFQCLPDDVKVNITPADTVLDALWDGGVAFASWHDVVRAIKERYGAEAQRRILDMLQELRMTMGAVKRYKEEFLKLLKELDEGYIPSANELLNIVQGAMYPELATEESVRWAKNAANMPVSWHPSQYSQLIDVCINVDEGLAVVAAKRKVAKTAGVVKPTVGVKRKGEAFGANAAAGAGGAPSGAPSGGPSGGPSKVRKLRVDFSSIRWKDPRVQKAADAGLCINCLTGDHRSRKCDKPWVFRERLQGPGGPKGAKNGTR
jgi:hypothetical protein